MKKGIVAMLTLAVCGVAVIVFAAQDTEITVREVRNPNELAAWLNANAADAEARLAAGGSVADTLALINAADAGTAKITLQADKADDAGDFFGIVATDGSGLAIQSDASAKGTLATKVTISAAGGIAAADAVTLTDADGAAVISAIGFEANDATLVLDADQGDDAEDTWTIESEAADNDLSFVNSTTEMMKISTAGVVTSTDDFVATDDLIAGDDLSVGDDATITGAATVGETLGVTGVATFTAESVHNGGIDTDYVTIDAGYGVDVKSSGTLKLGETTATKVEISVAGIETEVQGTLDVIGGLDVNEDVTIDLDAADEEIAIAQTSTAGTADTPLISINDDRTGATANTPGEATLKIDAEGTHAIGVIDGIVAIESSLDTYAAGTLKLGDDVATKVEVADTAVTTEIQGPLTVLGSTGAGIDAMGATALYIGEATATSVVLGASDADTTVAGDLVVTGLDIDSAAGPMTVGKATATSLALGASDITTTINGTTVAAGALWLGTNGYFEVVGGALNFVGHNSFTNEIDGDITQ